MVETTLRRSDKKEKRVIQRRFISPTSTNRKLYKEKRKHAQKEIIKAKNDHWDKICQEINSCIENTRANRTWKTIKTSKRKIKTKQE